MLRSISRAIAATAIGAIAATGAALGLGAAAAAAAEYDYPAAIDPASIVVTTVDGSPGTGVHEHLRIDASWSVPDGATAGQTFGFTLPPEFAAAGGGAFAVAAADDPASIVAQCTVSSDAAPVVACTLTDYVDGRTAVAGSLWFLVTADESTESSTVEFVVDGKATPVAVPGGGITPGKNLPTEPQKWSSVTEDGRIEWVIVVPGAAFAGAAPIVIDDVLTPAGDGTAEHRNVDGELHVWATDETNTQPESVPGWSGEWNAEGTGFHLEIPGPIDPAVYYMVMYYTVPVVPMDGATFANVATVGGVTVRDTQVWTSSGGGSGTGTPTGRFELTKVVAGDAAAGVPADTAYTVTYSYGDPVTTQTLTVTAGVAATSIPLPVGTVVTLGEVELPVIDGIGWGTPAFAGDGVRPLDGGRAEITIGTGTAVSVMLTNTADTVTPPVPTTPTEPPAPPTTPVVPPELPLTGSLASTGTDVPLPLMYAAGAIILLGLAMTTRAAVLRRRR